MPGRGKRPPPQPGRRGGPRPALRCTAGGRRGDAKTSSPASSPGPGGRHGATGGRGEGRRGGRRCSSRRDTGLPPPRLPAAPSRPGGADPAAALRRSVAERWPGSPRPSLRPGHLPSARERISDTVFCTVGIAARRGAVARPPPPARPAPAARRSAPRAAAWPGARAAGRGRRVRAAGPGSGSGGGSGTRGGRLAPRLRLPPLAPPLVTDSRGASAPRSPAPSGTYQLRLPPASSSRGVPPPPPASAGSGLPGRCA